MYFLVGLCALFPNIYYKSTHFHMGNQNPGLRVFRGIRISSTYPGESIGQSSLALSDFHSVGFSGPSKSNGHVFAGFLGTTSFSEQWLWSDDYWEDDDEDARNRVNDLASSQANRLYLQCTVLHFGRRVPPGAASKQKSSTRGANRPTPLHWLSELESCRTD